MRIARALGSLPNLRRHLAPSKITTQSGRFNGRSAQQLKDPGERGQFKFGTERIDHLGG